MDTSRLPECRLQYLFNVCVGILHWSVCVDATHRAYSALFRDAILPLRGFSEVTTKKAPVMPLCSICLALSGDVYSCHG